MPYYVHDGNPKIKLPDTYQYVGYIENNGTQYIDTGYKPNELTKIVMSFSSTSNIEYVPLFGSWNINTDSRFNTWFFNTNQCSFGFGDNNGSSEYVSIVLNKINTIETYADSTKVYIKNNDTIVSYNKGNFVNPNYNVYIFTRNNSGSTTSFSKFKLHRFKIYDNNDLVRDFVACYRKSDNVAGLYDLVNGVFYTNAGTGSFTIGPKYNNSVYLIKDNNNSMNIGG